MLFVSKASRLRVTFRGASDRFAPNGAVIEHRPRVYAEFRHGPVPDWAMKQVLARIDFGFLAEGWSPEQQVATFDSFTAQRDMGWSDEEREALEQYMLGKGSEDFIMVEPEKAPVPWAAYDKLSARKGLPHEQAVDKIFNIVRDTGIDPQVVIDYERENRNRADVIQMMENLAGSKVESDDGDILVGA